MIGKRDLETEAGNAEFDECCKTTKRYIKSKIFSLDDVEELVQETITRVLEKLSADLTFKVNVGYFINTAKRVLFEYYRRQKIANERTKTDDESETEQPLDAESQLTRFAEQQGRAIYNECLLECFEECNLDEQVLLWRYCFDEEYRLDDDDNSNKNLFASLLDSIRAIRDKFLPLQNDHSPVTGDVRVKVSRCRKKLRICLANCLSRKRS